MSTNISVCMATHNGARFIAEQLRSITGQLSADDEIVIVDDHSTDETIKIATSLNLPRLKILTPPQRLGPVKAFELAVGQAAGELIFLADQDDVWLPGRVAAMRDALTRCDLVVCDAVVVDENLEVIHPSFFAVRRSGPGVLRNIFKNSFIGCCMAFSSRVARASLPIPSSVYMHDVWFGLIASSLYRVKFLNTPFVQYRRHGATVTGGVAVGKRPSWDRLRRRVLLAAALLKRVTWNPR
jgi:glycosyltransferase involved in cell wall biosynthesis